MKGTQSMLEINEERMSQVIQDAFDAATSAPKDSKRWQTAIAKAKTELESNPFLHWQGDALLILSSSNEIYTANGTCQCKAYMKGFPCWHRAAARLVARYNETSH